MPQTGPGGRGTLVRLAVRVPLEEAEQARALALDLVPGGFEERIEQAFLELGLYVDDSEVNRIRAAFPDAGLSAVEPGWEDAWRAFHRPVRVGGIWVGPPWEQPPAGVPAVVIDPGRAFGTGAHPTTRLCVELLAAAPRGSLLDVGCGSGVLAIAGARLGYGPIRAVDDDPVAVDVTRANAAANRVEVETWIVDAERDALPATDVAVANVLLRPVETILARLDAGVAITSGYLAGETPLAPGWRVGQGLELDGWAAHLLVRAGGESLEGEGLLRGAADFRRRSSV